MTDKTEHYDQREELHRLGKMGGRVVSGWHQPVSDGRPLGPPPGSEKGKEWADEARARTSPVMVECSACGHQWACAYLPMPLDQAAKLMQSARCPKGCVRPIHVANVPAARDAS